MTSNAGGIYVDPAGYPATVSITTPSGAYPTTYSDVNCTSVIANPTSITSRTGFFVPVPVATATVSVIVNGVEYAGGVGKTLAYAFQPGDVQGVVVNVPPNATAVGVSVKTFGAKGDGTTDDTAAVQAAINAVGSSGGTVIVPVGNYLCGQLTISYALKMVGEGGWGISDGTAARIVAKSGLNDHLIKFTPPATKAVVGAVFYNLVVDHQGANQTAGSAFYAQGAIQCLWDHCHITNPYMNGIYLFQDGNGGTGHHNRIVHCLIDGGNTSPSGDGRGLRMEASDENFVIACDFENNGRAAASEPNHIFDLSGLNTIIGNSFVGGQSGVKVQGDRSRIIGNMFDGVGNHNVRLNGARNVVEGNTFSQIGVGSSSNTIDGVWVDNVSENVIVGNVFHADGGGGARSGVNLTSGPATSTLIGHNFFSTANGSFGTAAINLGTGTGHSISGNKGYNPVGKFGSQPSVQSSTSPYTNSFGVDATVHVTAGTAATTVAVGGQTALALTASAQGTFRVPANQTITLTYASGSPTWVWFGD